MENAPYNNNNRFNVNFDAIRTRRPNTGANAAPHTQKHIHLTCGPMKEIPRFRSKQFYAWKKREEKSIKNKRKEYRVRSFTSQTNTHFHECNQKSKEIGNSNDGRCIRQS